MSCASECASAALTDGGFFVGQFFRQTRFGALTGFLGLRFVNVFGANRHVGENGNAFAGDLHKAVADGEENVLAAFFDMDFARDQLRHQAACAAAGCPSRLRLPVSVTMSTSSEKVFASGVTISSLIVAILFYR